MPSVTTPRAMLSYPSLFEARSIRGSKPKFGSALIFDPQAQKTPEYAAMLAAWQEVKRDNYPKIPIDIDKTFRRVKEGEERQGYSKGFVFINPRSDQAPDVVDR